MQQQSTAEMDGLACDTKGDVEKHQIGDVLQAEPASKLKLETIELHGEEFWPLSGKPFFNITISKSHVKPGYQMMVPVKMSSMLPSATIPLIITYMGKDWKAFYNGDHQNRRFCVGWKEFAEDLNLKPGDACVFELMEKSIQLLKFRVQILRGDIPQKFLDMANGESADYPIVIE